MYKFSLAEYLSPTLCQNFPDKIFVFGDNMIGKGKKGQAIIRDEPNAFGVPTKRLPSMSENAFFSDRADEIEIVQTRLAELKKIAEYREVVLPTAIIGTGLAELNKRSPKIMAMIKQFYEMATRENRISRDR